MCCTVDDVDMKDAIELPHLEPDVLGTRAHVCMTLAHLLKIDNLLLVLGEGENETVRQHAAGMLDFPVFVDLLILLCHQHALSLC